MSIPNVELLYASYDKLSDNLLNIAQRKEAFDVILKGVKGNEIEKRLSSQFIARFAKLFEDYLEKSFSCLLDLCDDDDINVRKQVVHDLLIFSKYSKKYVPRVADIFVQLCQTEDKQELNIIYSALLQLLHVDSKATMEGIFSQLLSVNSEYPRENALKFLSERLKTLPERVMTNDIETFVVEQINTILLDVSEDEFQLSISILASLRCMSTLIGRQKLVNMITQQALHAVQEFNPLDRACIAQIRESCKQAALCVSKNVHAHELYLYLLDKVLPCICDFTEDTYDDRLSLLRFTAELISFPNSEIASVEKDLLIRYLESVYKLLLYFLPTVITENPTKVNDDSNGCKIDSHITGVKYSELEAILFIACQLSKYYPQFFGGLISESERDSDLVKDGLDRLRAIRPRLQYLNQVAHDYASSLSNILDGNSKCEDNHLKLMAHKLMTNTQSMVRCFFHNPPSFKNLIMSLSWLQNASNQISGSKRSAVTSGSDPTVNARLSRIERKIYTPPIGQWSRINNFNKGGKQSKRPRNFI